MSFRLGAPGVALACLGVAVGCGGSSPAPKPKPPTPPLPHPAATWPWPRAEVTHPHKGVTRWVNGTSPDGTVVELIRFDFGVNPKLRFELYDQDEDDALPGDNKADYYPNGIGRVAARLNADRGKLVAAWNGPFFGYDRSKNPPHGLAFHVAPVALAGVGRYNVGLVRWGFGVRTQNGGPKFQVAYRPDARAMARLFDYGASGLQCLVRDGNPLGLSETPASGEGPAKQPVTASKREAGHIPYVDDMRTSRTSMAWSKNSRLLYLLVVDAPGTETGARLAVKYGRRPGPGWTLADLQHFWRKLKVWGAVNNDGGSVTQFVLLRPDGRYDLMPPQIAAPRFRLVCGPDFAEAPAGGTLMTWYVREQE